MRSFTSNWVKSTFMVPSKSGPTARIVSTPLYPAPEPITIRGRQPASRIAR